MSSLGEHPVPARAMAADVAPDTKYFGRHGDGMQIAGFHRGARSGSSRSATSPAGWWVPSGKKVTGFGGVRKGDLLFPLGVPSSFARVILSKWRHSRQQDEVDSDAASAPSTSFADVGTTMNQRQAAI
jgi:hypothetical protein